MAETVGTSLEANDSDSAGAQAHASKLGAQSNFTFRYNPLGEGALSTPKHSITVVTNLRVRETIRF